MCSTLSAYILSINLNHFRLTIFDAVALFYKIFVENAGNSTTAGHFIDFYCCR